MMRWVCYILGFYLTMAMVGCQNDSGTLGLVYNTTDKSYSLVLTDTATLQTSTILLDSMPSSAVPSMLIGRCDDPKLGKIQSNSFIQIDLGPSWNPTLDLTFDSLVLVMKYSGYYYGDTTQSQSYEVRQVTEDFFTYNLSPFWVDQLKFSSLTGAFFPGGSIYNHRKTSVDEVSPPLGTFTLKPRPTSKDSITVRLRDAVGQAWLTEAQRPDISAFDFQSNFLKYFKGLCIRSTSTSGPHVIGLAATSFVIRFYYKGMINELVTGQHRNFLFNSSFDYNYNQITADRSGTLLANLESKREISSKLTNNESYIESGVGIMTKISFPHIMDIAGIGGFRQVNSARLIVEPTNLSYDNKFRLPPLLTLLTTDNSNLPLQTVSADFSSGLQSAGIVIDGQHNTNSAYIFSVTQYVQSLINAGGPGRTGNALLLSTPLSTSAALRPSIFNSIDRLCVGNDPTSQYRVRLEVYFFRENE